MRRGLWTRRQLLEAGYCDADLRRWLSSNRAVRPRRGTYLPLPDPRMADPQARHALAVAAAIPGLPAGGVVSHTSAAVWHGLPVWGLRLGRVHVTRDGVGSGRSGRRLHVHAARCEPEEIDEVGGVLVTSPARTVVDLARAAPFEQAVVIADAALYQELVDLDSLAEAVARATRRPGNAAARRAIAFADGRSESVGESRSRVAILRLGLPMPDLQVEVDSASGRKLGRVDFYWAEHDTVGEFDGEVKYGRLLRPGQEPGDVVFEEKVREDDIRDTGLQVARWIWRELSTFDEVAKRLLRAFHRG